MPYPEIQGVEKLRLTFIRCLKLLQVADMIRKTKVCWYIIPDIEQTGKNYIKAKDQNHTDFNQNDYQIEK